MLTINNLTKRYKKKTVLDIPSLQISNGKCTGLVGNNGAGKTTFMNLILDLILPTEGAILSKGKNVLKSEHWKPYTSSYIDDSHLIPFLSPLEYFDFVGNLYGLSKKDVRSFLESAHGFYTDTLAENDKLIQDHSKGNKNKIGLLAALMTRPEFLLLDEPFSNLDPSSQIWLKTKLIELKQEHTTVFISSHDLKHIVDVCDHILILNQGKITKEMEVEKKTFEELEQHFQKIQL